MSNVPAKNNSLLDFKDNLQPILLVFCSMIYVTLKLVCNPLFLRQIQVNIGMFDYYSIKCVGSAFIYSLIYIVSDMIVMLSNRKSAIIIVCFGIFCDGLFSALLQIVSSICGLKIKVQYFQVGIFIL